MSIWLCCDDFSPWLYCTSFDSSEIAIGTTSPELRSYLELILIAFVVVSICDDMPPTPIRGIVATNSVIKS
jgi:hypothetical protein